MRWPTPCKSPRMSWRNLRRPLPKLTSTAMVSSVTMSCMSSSRKPTCLFLGTKSERSSRNS
ncbi:hypothetical protein Q9966_001176 [Columba livia]|nr:hypothetical protein Q9966_001176 [Columba livia]